MAAFAAFIISTQNKNKMRSLEIKQKNVAANVAITRNATLWITGKFECSLYVKPNSNGYDWIMISPYTGRHLIKQFSGLEPIMNDRIRLHWKGFQQNNEKYYKSIT